MRRVLRHFAAGGHQSQSKLVLVVDMGVGRVRGRSRWCRSYLDGAQHCMCLACYSDDDGTLFDCLGGVFDLEDPALWRAKGLGLGQLNRANSRDGTGLVCLQCD